MPFQEAKILKQYPKDKKKLMDEANAILKVLNEDIVKNQKVKELLHKEIAKLRIEHDNCIDICKKSKADSKLAVDNKNSKENELKDVLDKLHIEKMELSEVIKDKRSLMKEIEELSIKKIKIVDESREIKALCEQDREYIRAKKKELDERKKRLIEAIKLV